MEVPPEPRPPVDVSPEQLRDAIEGRAMELYFQPIVSLDDRSATLLEALPRWPRRDGEVLGPSDFIDVAEANGMLGGLERWGIKPPSATSHDGGRG